MFSASSINVSVPEGLSAGAVVDTITAVDDDVGVNAQFGYQIAGGTGQGWARCDQCVYTHTHAQVSHTHTHTYTHTHTHTHTYTQISTYNFSHRIV